MPLPVSLLRLWRDAYAGLQPAVTGLTALLPLSTLDTALLCGGAVIVWLVWTRRRRMQIVPAILALLCLLAACWLLFLALWGWNYQVPTLEVRLGLAPGETSPEKGASFVRATIAQLNALHAGAHATPWPTRADLPDVLGPRLARVLPSLGVPARPRLPVPRRTMLDWYFRSAGIDGMTNPFGLEVIINAQVLAVELPALAAHEYAHLAGFADEADASVVAWLACQSGSPALRYSSALAVLPHVLTGLPRAQQRDLLSQLSPGPREDLEAIRRRLSQQRPWVHAFAWQSYDRFLRANRVGEGVARYDAVARVLIAVADPISGSLTRLPPPWPPTAAR